VTKETSILGTIGEDHGKYEEFGIAAQKNFSGERERHVRKVMNLKVGLSLRY
jgi:hypothetical protein